MCSLCLSTVSLPPDSPLRHGPQMMRPGAMFRRVFPLQELENRLRQGKAVTFQGVLPVLRQEMLVVALPLPLMLRLKQSSSSPLPLQISR
jgi:hypothetical protein